MTWVETRNKMRIERLRAELAEVREQHNFDRTVRLRQFSASPARGQSTAHKHSTPTTQTRPVTSTHAVTYTSTSAGISSRVPNQPPNGGQGTSARPRSRGVDAGRPMIVVASLPAHADGSVAGVPHRVCRLLGEISGIDARAEVASAASAVTKRIGGPKDARALAATFGSRPAIVVYFTVSADDELAAHAYLATVFDSTIGGLAQSIVIARYGHEKAATSVMVGAGDLPTYRYISLDELPDRSNEDIVAYTVTWFLLAVLDAYWRLKNGTDPGLLAQTRSGERPVLPDVHTSNPFLAGAVEQRARLEQEASTLTALGFIVTAEEVNEQYVGIHAQSSATDVIFVIDAGYPNTPPVVIRAGNTTIEIEDSDWTSECTMADIVEALL